MLHRFPAWLIAAAFVLLTMPAQAAPVYLSPSDYDPKILLPAPPAEDSPAAKAELAELDRIQAERSQEAFARADHDFRTRNGSIFAEAIGPAFDLGKLPATAQLLANVQKDEDAAASVAKDYFRRTRPWIVDPALNSCSKMDDPHSSYPSGHSTMAYAMAVVLASLVPEKAPAIMGRAADYAENRLVCGMHRRRDIQAGQVLGTVVAELLLRNPGFKTEFEAAKEELRVARVTR
jgi:acid phosphatase (class A)